ncbi:MAG: response regulator [Campylobacterales bacterium]|nr:response regulator [Campylobacterales bacterium]
MQKDVLNNFSILYVEDEKEIRDLLDNFLKRKFKNIYIGTNGKEGLDLFLEYKPDIVLTDITMPIMNGLAMAREIKKISQNTPIIVLSAHNETAMFLEAIDIGIDDYMLKPISLKSLSAKFEKISTNLVLKQAIINEQHLSQEILNSSENIISFVTKKDGLKMVNKKFYQYFDFKDLDDFLSKHKCICEMFIRDNGFFVADGFDSGKWIDEILANRDKIFKVKMIDKNQEELIFTVNIKPIMYDLEEYFIITYNNITMVEDAMNLERELFSYKERYHTKQQESAFSKQLKIIKDSLSNKKIDDFYIDSYYKPLDILSGDTYGTIDLGEKGYLFYIIDAMGKGLSASVTSIQSTSFINNAVEKALEHNDFNFLKIVSSYSSYIKKQLLEEEIVCIIFIYINKESKKIELLNYGMPPILIQTVSQEFVYIRPSNPPIMEFIESEVVDEIDLDTIDKLFFSSDGINEALTIDNKVFDNYLNDTFENAIFKQDIVNVIDDKIKEFEDDMTFIYFKREFKNILFWHQFEINSCINEIEKFQEVFEAFLYDLELGFMETPKIMVVMSELLLNALEHGNYQITFNQKQKMLEDGTFHSYLEELSHDITYFNKKIKILIIKYEYFNQNVFEISIEDEGLGFDVNLFFKKLKLQHSINQLNGRGIILSQKLVDAVFYNEIGNKVTIMKTSKKA